MQRILVAMCLLAFALTACDGESKDEEPIATRSSTTVPATTTTTTTSLQSTTTQPIDGRRPIVIDTDMSVEGAMAILYLLQHPDVRVEAITISGTGLVRCSAGVEQALGLVALASAEEIPVACGSTTPLEGDNAFPSSFRTAAGTLSGVLLPLGGDPSELSAAELLAAVITDTLEPVVVYADGPLTNVAELLKSDPRLVDQIDRIYAMGGAVDVAGNTFENVDAEWNIWVDPSAAELVLSSGVPITLVPLDATNDVPFTVLHVSDFEKYQSTPIAEMVFKLARGASGISDGFIYFWDQLNAAVLTDQSLVTLEDRNLAVTTGGGPGLVGTLMEIDDGAPVQVAVGADREAFEREFFSIIFGESVEAVDLTPDFSVTFDGTSWTHDLPEEFFAGPIVPSFTNASVYDAALVVVRLLGDATPADLDAWEGTAQPPFVEVVGGLFASSGSGVLGVIDLTEAETHYLAGLVIELDTSVTVGILEVSE